MTHVAGQATYQAALALQQQLCEVAATVLGCPPSAVALDNGACVVHSAPIQRLTFAAVAAAASAGQRSLRAQKLYRVSQSPHMSPFTAQVVEVEVDPDTGQVRLLNVVTTHDVGTIINPLGHQGQIEGGLMQGIGFGLLEEMRTDEGRVGTLSLGEYKLPNIKDIPPLRTVLAQEELGPAPFQGNAIGESSRVLPLLLQRLRTPYTTRLAYGCTTCRLRQKRSITRSKAERGEPYDPDDHSAGERQGAHVGGAGAAPPD